MGQILSKTEFDNSRIFLQKKSKALLRDQERNRAEKAVDILFDHLKPAHLNVLYSNMIKYSDNTDFSEAKETTCTKKDWMFLCCRRLFRKSERATRGNYARPQKRLKTSDWLILSIFISVDKFYPRDLIKNIKLNLCDFGGLDYPGSSLSSQIGKQRIFLI